jgi:hypothetical protein
MLLAMMWGVVATIYMVLFSVAAGIEREPKEHRTVHPIKVAPKPEDGQRLPHAA